jgi:hypothetical protein
VVATATVESEAVTDGASAVDDAASGGGTGSLAAAAAGAGALGSMTSLGGTSLSAVAPARARQLCSRSRNAAVPANAAPPDGVEPDGPEDPDDEAVGGSVVGADGARPDDEAAADSAKAPDEPKPDVPAPPDGVEPDRMEPDGPEDPDDEPVGDSVAGSEGAPNGAPAGWPEVGSMVAPGALGAAKAAGPVLPWGSARAMRGPRAMVVAAPMMLPRSSSADAAGVGSATGWPSMLSKTVAPARGLAGCAAALDEPLAPLAIGGAAPGSAG